MRRIKETAAVFSATIEVSNPIVQKRGAVTMYCSTSLEIQPILLRLPRGLAILLILAVLARTCSPVSIPHDAWWPALPFPQGHWRQRKPTVHWTLGPQWLARLSRLLVRSTLFGLLLHSSGWVRVTPLTWALMLLPVTHSLALRRPFTRSKEMRRWVNTLQRLYQLTFLALVLSTLGQRFRPFAARPTGFSFSIVLGTWCTQQDEEAEICILTQEKGHCQVRLQGTYLLDWQPRDSFERWMFILFLRKLRRTGASRPFLTQSQVSEAFHCHQCEVSRWETLVRQHGWHVLSDRYRHQLRSALPDPELSRKILDLWVPAFWLSAWDVRERLIALALLPNRGALPLESLHKLAHHTGFAQVRQILLQRFDLQDGQIIAREHWWLEELLALNERLIAKLERGERITPQELFDVKLLRLQTPSKRTEVASPPLAAAMRQALFTLPQETAHEPICCTYCGSDHTAPKSKKPRLKTIVDPISGQKRQIEVLRHYCHNPDCAHKTFTHFPPGVLPHSPYPLQIRLLAVEVYEVLLSTYRRSARMFKVKASTLYHWVASFYPAAAALAAYLGLVRTSGVVGIDDKWVKVCSPSQVPAHGNRPRAVWRYAYFAVDVYSYDILALELYPQHNDQAVHLLLLELKAKGVYPRVVVTDLDPAYGRMLPKVFPRAVHHECIFHALQNASRQLNEAYGRYYRENNPLAAQLHEDAIQVFRAKTQKTARKRFHGLIHLRQECVSLTPKIAPFFDSLERHFPKLVNALEHPLIPKTNNATELVIRRFDQHYQSMCGLDSLESARTYLRVFELVYRLTPFADDNPSSIRGKCPLELAGYDLEALPIAEFFRQLKLPSLASPGEEAIPMA